MDTLEWIVIDMVWAAEILSILMVAKGISHLRAYALPNLDWTLSDTGVLLWQWFESFRLKLALVQEQFIMQIVEAKHLGRQNRIQARCLFEQY